MTDGEGRHRAKATRAVLDYKKKRDEGSHQSSIVQQLELACDQQRAGAVGLSPVVLGEAGVPAFICARQVEDLQAPVLPDGQPEEEAETLLERALQYEIFSTLRRSKVRRMLLHRCVGDEKRSKYSECPPVT